MYFDYTSRCPPTLHVERERKTGVRDGSKVVGLVTGRKKLLSNEMGKAVARASLGGRSGDRLEFGVPANYLSAGVGYMSGV